MAVWTNTGLNLVATAIQTSGQSVNIAYVGISLGCGTLQNAITGGVQISTLTLNAGIPASLSSGQSLTITDGTNTDTCTLNGAHAQGAIKLTVNAFTPAHSYVANTSGVAPTPAATDTALYSEGVRIAANAGAAGASVGESLNSGYFDGTQATGVYMTVGFFGGSTATASTGTGTLMIEDVQLWNHTVNNDSNMYQADSTI